MTGLSRIPVRGLTQHSNQGGPYHFPEEPGFMTTPSPVFRRCSFYPESLLDPTFLLSFRRIKLISTISGSTESRLTGRSAPLSRLVRLRTVGPLQKLEWREHGFLPKSTQSSQRLSHLDVTQLSEIMRFPFHYTPKKFRKIILIS